MKGGCAWNGRAGEPSGTLGASLSPESASGAQEETVGGTCRAGWRGALCLAALFVVGTAAAEEPEAEFLEYLGATAGMDPELVAFMDSREARRAIKDAESRTTPDGETDAATAERRQLIADGAGRWQSMSETSRAAAHSRFDSWRELPQRERERLQDRWRRFRELTPGQQEALREAYREFLELPPERRRAISDRWQQMSEEERRRAINRRQGAKPGTVDKRPCPPC